MVLMKTYCSFSRRDFLTTAMGAGGAMMKPHLNSKEHAEVVADANG
jgi:hypothetical protein